MTVSVLNSFVQMFENSGIEAAFYDVSKSLAWSNSQRAGKMLSAADFSSADGQKPGLPLKGRITLRHASGAAAEVWPVFEGGDLAGWAVTFAEGGRLTDLVCNSGSGDMIENTAANIRSALSELMAARDRIAVEHEDEPDIRELVRATNAAVCRVLSMTANATELLRFNREENAGTDGVSEKLRQTLEWTAGLFEKNGCIIETDIEKGIYAELDFDKLETVLLNLLVNGYMYNPKEDKRLFVELKAQGELLVLSVTDNGRGADLEKLKAAASGLAGHKAERSETLGLRLAKLFAEKYDGSLGFSFTEEGGLCVTLKLRCIDPDAPAVFRMTPAKKLYIPFCRQQCILAKGLKEL